MPLFEYGCRHGHTESLLVKFEDRPPSVVCSSCGDTSTLALSAPAFLGTKEGRTGEANVEAMRRDGWRAEETPGGIVRERGTGMVLVDWRCAACGRTDFGVYDATPAKPPACACGAEMVEVVGAPGVDWFTHEYGATGGYRCTATGEWITSKAHHARVMAERGLVDLGDYDLDAMKRKQQDKVEKQVAHAAEMAKRWDTDPGYAGFREARDQGRTPGWDWLR